MQRGTVPGESKCRNRDFVRRNLSHSCKGRQTPRTKKVFETICCWVLSPRALFLLKTNKRTVPALTCPYSYRHRMMTIFFLLQAWHGYRFTFTQGRSAFLADAASLASFFPKMSSCRKSVFSGLPWPTICVWFRTLFLKSFFELRYRLCFFILNGNFIFFSQERLFFLKKQP